MLTAKIPACPGTFPVMVPSSSAIVNCPLKPDSASDTPIFCRSCSVISVIGFPKSSIVPLSAFTRPSIRRIAVLFPAPFFPISPVILPSGTSVRFEPGEEKEVKKLDFDQRISASIHNHHH